MARKLKCSFCGKDETEVEKLAAGAKRTLTGRVAHICDRCVFIAYEVMSEPQPPTSGPVLQRKVDVEAEDDSSLIHAA